MPNVIVYNQEGKKAGEMELNAAHFGVKVKSGLVHEVLVAQQANRRRAISSVKTKGEVSGGGKKPFKQKGTGRARQGSIRSPQWVGGGIVFGPSSERNYSVKINRKAKQKALFMALSEKVASNAVFVLESFAPKAEKTKEAAKLFSALPIPRKALAVIPTSNPTLLRMVRNLPNVKLVTANSVNLEDILLYPTIVFWKDAIAAFESIYTKA